MTPYINHPIAVANFLSSTGITDVRVLQAAILHDTVEDTCTTIGECGIWRDEVLLVWLLRAQVLGCSEERAKNWS